MFGLTMDQFALLIAPVAALALLLVIYLTRPGPRRVGGALLGGLFAGTLNLVLDSVAFSLGLWRYPFTHAAFGPLGFYLAVGLFYGAGMALIGWRIDRRFGRRGVRIAPFLLCCLWATAGLSGISGGQCCWTPVHCVRTRSAGGAR